MVFISTKRERMVYRHCNLAGCEPLEESHSYIRYWQKSSLPVLQRPYIHCPISAWAETTDCLTPWSGYPARDTLPTVTLPFAFGDRAEETICLIVDTCREEECVGRARQGTIAKA